MSLDRTLAREFGGASASRPAPCSATARRAGWSCRPHVTSLLLLALALPASAALRVPQVPVSGTALQSFFSAQGQAIDVNTAQQDLQRFSVPNDIGFQVNEFGSSSAGFGVYNAADANPALYLAFPGSAAPGWFVVASFRTSPIRLVVNLFDASSTFMGSTTYLGADHADFGFYVQDAGGTFYSQDERNPGGAPKILAFNGTGAHAGSTWFACETSAGPGGDFADVIVLLGTAPTPVPVLHASWGALKQRFR